MRKNFLFALSTLIGTIVGAGVFGIPYVIAKSGIVPGFFYFGRSGTFNPLIFWRNNFEDKRKATADWLFPKVFR